MEQQRTQGVTVGPVEDLKAMVSAIAAYKMRPVIDRIFSFRDARDAFSYMSEGKFRKDRPHNLQHVACENPVNDLLSCPIESKPQLLSRWERLHRCLC
jgi:hypothetical protein